MKIHLVTAEHFRDAGLVQRAFATERDAIGEAWNLVNQMLTDSDMEKDANPTTHWREELDRLQDYHGAAHCYVEIAEIEVAGGAGAVVNAYEPADSAEIDAARDAYQDDDLQIDDDAAVSRADEGCWVSAWVWIANDDAEGEE